MANARKLAGEIDRTLKKLNEGIEVFDQIWDKVYSATNPSQKEKHEADLKKEIKKLQRFREQIKNWISNNDAKDKKQTLMNARRSVETKMEQFKVMEKEMKTKAYSKEGLAKVEKIDPNQQAKMNTRDWIQDCITQLSEQMESFEADIERLGSGKGKRQNKAEIASLTTLDARHKWHVLKLEQITRLLDNDGLEAENIDSVKEDIEYYLEANMEPDFMETYGEEDIYEALCLDDNTAGFVTTAAEKAAAEKKQAEEEAAEAKAAADKATAEKAAAAAAVLSDAKASTAAASSTVKTSSSSSGIPVIGRGKTSSTADKKSPKNPSSTNSIIRVSGSSTSTSSEKIIPPPDVDIYAKKHKEMKQRVVVTNTESSSTTAMAAALKSSTTTSQRPGMISPNNNNSSGPSSTPPVSSTTPKTTTTASSSSLLLSPSNSTNNNTVSTSVGTLTNEQRTVARVLDSSFQNTMPSSEDSNRKGPYVPRNPISTSSSYPSTQAMFCDRAEIYREFELDTLFFIFYYQQGTYQQWLAAKELKRQSWAYHKKYMTWFKRHEEPKVTCDEFEQGTYVYFDYETGWCQRIKSEFTFEYSYLQDE